MTIEAINPTNGTFIKQYKAHTSQQIKTILDNVNKAWHDWSATPFKARAKLMHKVADTLRKNKTNYATIMTKEMGKPISDAIAEVEKCATVCDFYATHASNFLAPQKIKTNGMQSYVAFKPLGVILAVMPWNYPLWQVFRFAAPTLMAGNGVILKHASNVPACALIIEELFANAGFPKNLFRTLLVSSNQVAALIANPIVQGVSLTGSVAAGKSVASTAGKYLKKVVLELGGSDPYLILKDADIEKAATAAISSRFKNGGQTCIAAKRLIVVKSIAKTFTDHCLRLTKNYTVGDPMNHTTQIGPMARFDLRDQIHAQVTATIAKGAKCLLGGKVPKKGTLAHGAFYPPTLLTNVKKGMPAYEEEIFGPVAAIIEVADQEEAIKVANDSSFGLAGAVFSENINTAEHIAHHKINTGICFVNHQAFSHPQLPFGGIKESGYGRELSHFGIMEFVNVKTIAIKK